MKAFFFIMSVSSLICETLYARMEIVPFEILFATFSIIMFIAMGGEHIIEKLKK